MYAQQNTHKFKIDGEVLGSKNNGKIVLSIVDADQIYKARVKEGKFVFEGEIASPAKGWFIFDKIYSIPFYIEKSTFKVQLSLYKYDNKLNYPMEAIWTIENIEGNLTEELSREYSNFEAKHKNNLRYNYLLFNYLNEKISKYPDNKLYFDIIFNFSRRQQYLTYSQLINLIGKIDLSY